MWYWWTRINHATKVPGHLRVDFERYGEAVVAQILGRPYTHSIGTVGVPTWDGSDEAREHALAWLREMHNKEERRRDVNEAMEVAIIVLVAVEVALSLYGTFVPVIR